MPTLSDPRRLPRRNHYQEGPNFLFPATHTRTGRARIFGDARFSGERHMSP